MGRKLAERFSQLLADGYLQQIASSAQKMEGLLAELTQSSC